MPAVLAATVYGKEMYTFSNNSSQIADLALTLSFSLAY